MKKFLFLLGMTAMMAFFAWNGLAEEAADLTEKCAIDVSVYRRNMEYMLDEETTTKWETGNFGGYVEVKTPAGKKSQGVYVQWGAKPIDIWVQVPSKDGKTWINDPIDRRRFGIQCFQNRLSGISLGGWTLRVRHWRHLVRFTNRGHLGKDPPCQLADNLLVVSGRFRLCRG